MFDLYVTICDKNLEVMILDHDVLRVRFLLLRNCECDCLLIDFVKCGWIFEKIAQCRLFVSLKIDYEPIFFLRLTKFNMSLIA